MNYSVITSLTQSLSWIASVIGFAAVLIQFYLWYGELSNGPLGQVLFFVALASVIAFFLVVVSTLIAAYFNPLPPDKLARLALAGVEKYVPAETVKVLQSFLASILPHIIRYRQSFATLREIKFLRLTRSFRLEGRDLTRTEEYQWINKSRRPMGDFPIVSFGGNIQTFIQSAARSWEIVEGQATECTVSPVEIVDRVMLLNVRLNQTKARGSEGTLFFTDFAAGSMLPDWDMIFIAQTAMVEKQINEIVFVLDADRPIVDASMYALSIITGRRDTVRTRIELSAGGRHLEASVDRPNKNAIYYMIFKRN